MGIKPLKKFGQNYLVDKNIVNNLIQPLDLKSTDHLIEIGPGKGFITEEIYSLVDNLFAVEIDTRVIEDLKCRFANLSLFQEDFLKFNLNSISSENKIKIIGNIPFNLTGSILFKLVENRKLISECSLLLPFDIGKKLVAQKRTKDYGILTVVFNYFSSSKIIKKVSRNVFLPRPNIEAAIANIKFDKKEDESIDSKLFIKLVKAAFGNRRKTLNNSLRNSIFNNCDFSNFGSQLTKRAEELEVDNFIELTRHLQNQECLKKTK